MLMCNDEKYGMQCGYCSEFVLEEHDKEIRADERTRVIDEFVKALEKNQTFGDNEFEMGLDFTDVLNVVEKLKSTN